MKKHLFLTSVVTLCSLCPAMADNFPQDGNMLENKTYTRAAVYDNTGVYEGDVVANADYTNNNYNVSAGSYFTGLDNNNVATTAQCTSGNYCPGVASTTYDDVNSAFVDDGLQACPQNYSGSAAGATANTDCYRACSTTDVTKSATVTGQRYYNGTDGDGVNACEPLTCVNGWSVEPRLNLSNTIGQNAGTNNANLNASSVFNESSNLGQSYYGISNAGDWAVDYGDNGILLGKGRCSTVEGSNNNYSWTNPTSLTTAEIGEISGGHCYCSITGYKTNTGEIINISSPWVYNFNNGANCSNDCAYNCSSNMRGTDEGNLAFRSALFSFATVPLAYCKANTIIINWNGATQAEIDATNAGATVYEGDIRTPRSAITIPGKTFRGWKFVKTSNNNNGNL